MVNGVWSAFEMARYQQQPAAHKRKSLRACSETRGCFNHDMINNPALKIGFTNNYRRWMGEVKFLNQNHFNYRVQRMRKDLCWWDHCRVKATIKARSAGSEVLIPPGITGSERLSKKRRNVHQATWKTQFHNITLIHQRPRWVCLMFGCISADSSQQVSDRGQALAAVWSSVWSSELHAAKWWKGRWVKGEMTGKGPKRMQITLEMINQMTDYMVLVGASAHLQTY